MSQEKIHQKTQNNLSFSYSEISLLVEFQKEHGSRWRVAPLFLIYLGALSTHLLCSRHHPTGWCWFVTTTPSLYPQTHRAQIGLCAHCPPQFLHRVPKSWALSPPSEPTCQVSTLAPPRGRGGSPTWAPARLSQSVWSGYLSAPHSECQAHRKPWVGRGATYTWGEPTNGQTGILVPVTPSPSGPRAVGM